MEILKQYPEKMEAKDKYNMLRNSEIGKMGDAKGQVLDVSAYILRIETDDNGENMKVLTVKTVEGDMYATNSRTFIREFEAILACTSPVFSIEVLEGMSKNERQFVTCSWY